MCLEGWREHSGEGQRFNSMIITNAYAMIVPQTRSTARSTSRWGLVDMETAARAFIIGPSSRRPFFCRTWWACLAVSCPTVPDATRNPAARLLTRACPSVLQYVPPPQTYDSQTGQPIPQDEDMLQDHFEEFYEDIFEELTNIGGELEQLRVCENLSDHLTGNVYAKFHEEEDAERALKALMVRA